MTFSSSKPALFNNSGHASAVTRNDPVARQWMDGVLTEGATPVVANRSRSLKSDRRGRRWADKGNRRLTAQLDGCAVARHVEIVNETGKIGGEIVLGRPGAVTATVGRRFERASGCLLDRIRADSVTLPDGDTTVILRPASPCSNPRPAGRPGAYSPLRGRHSREMSEQISIVRQKELRQPRKELLNARAREAVRDFARLPGLRRPEGSQGAVSGPVQSTVSMTFRVT